MSWYLVHAHTGREVVAEVNLARQGYVTFLPASLRTVRHARKTQTVRAAFFPGYLFVSLDLERQQWRQINSTLGVVRLVTSNERPLPAPRGLVDDIRKLCSADGFLKRRPVLNPGDAVRIDEGPLAGELGWVESLNGQDRVRVLLQLMNRAISVDVPQSACLPADASSLDLKEAV